MTEIYLVVKYYMSYNGDEGSFPCYSFDNKDKAEECAAKLTTELFSGVNRYPVIMIEDDGSDIDIKYQVYDIFDSLYVGSRDYELNGTYYVADFFNREVAAPFILSGKLPEFFPDTIDDMVKLWSAFSQDERILLLSTSRITPFQVVAVSFNKDPFENLSGM